METQPWISVRFLDGIDGLAETGFADLLTQAHKIADIVLPVPPAASGLWRILYLITARITELDDFGRLGTLKEWKRARRRVLEAGQLDPDDVHRYFAEYAGKFDLFDVERPWLQDPRLAEECAKSTGINKLVIGRAAGNNLVWLSHHTDLDPQPIRAAEAAWYLLAWSFYGPSGKITARTVNGRTESNMAAGPLRSRISFHPLGRNLFESLVLGIPYPGGEHARRPDADLAPWEENWDEHQPDPLGLPPTRKGLSGLLTGQFRQALLLSPSPDGSQVTDAWITWAWRMQPTEIPDPYLIYDMPRNGGMPFARYAKADRAIWRDLDALLLQGEMRQPPVFGHLPDASATGPLRVRAFGFDQDGQTVDKQWFTASTPPVLTMRDRDGAEPEYDHARDIGHTRVAAERVGSDLRQALRRAWFALSDPEDGRGKMRQDSGDGPWVPQGMSRYWPQAEALFWQMVGERDFGYPNNAFIRVALTAYDEMTERHARRGPRVARALERARGGIFATWTPAAQPPPEEQSA
ncbi:MAG: type I-E CRISPR-associated protein Cse1/CasA [Nocardiopsaceae bacterium]|nr:type I-E CRISPR-associated protein Cse1/CasA [Nocardiopsaceae bacterium]